MPENPRGVLKAMQSDVLQDALSEANQKPEFNEKASVCLDFDGVIHDYKEGWKDGTIYGNLQEGFIEFLDKLMKTNPVFICSTRNPDQIIEWLKKNLWGENEAFCSIKKIKDDDVFWNTKRVLGVTNRKLPAICYVDDRAVIFSTTFQPPLKAWEAVYNAVHPPTFNSQPKVEVYSRDDCVFNYCDCEGLTNECKKNNKCRHA